MKKQSGKRPNIVLMVSHDLGCHIGPYGNASAQSPHLNDFAAQGIRLDRHFVTSPGCSQSRSSLVTGRYPHANGQFGLANWGWKLFEDEVLLPSVLSSNGYHSRLFGVWHLHKWTLGSFDEISDDVSTLDTSPEGFADVAGTRAAEWIAGAASMEKPFYLHVGFWEVHRPFCGTEEQARVADALARGELPVPSYLPSTEPTLREMAELHQSVGLVDRGVGKILHALDQAGIAEDTLVIFTADHGLPFPRAKGTLYDPGIHVACLARWPGQIAPNTVSQRLSSNVDIMPTLLDAASIPVPTTIQGQSRLGVMLNGDAASDGEELVFAEKTYHEHYDPIRCLRTPQFKYIQNFEERPKLVLPTDIYLSPTRVSMADDENLWGRRDAEELYDVQADPGERENLAQVPELQTIRNGFRDRLREWMFETNDPLLKGPILRGPDQIADLGGRH